MESLGTVALLPLLEADFLAVIGDETAVADGIQTTEPASLKDLLTRVLGDDAENILLAASLDAGEELLRVLGVEGFESSATYDAIGFYA